MQRLTSMYDSEGQIYDLPDDKVDSFREKRGGERAFDYRLPDGSEYSIPESQTQRFAEVHPDAQPLRRLSFAGGKTRSFSAGELKDFLSGEYVTSPDYKADRDEDDARQKAAYAAEEKALAEQEGRAESEARLEKAAIRAGAKDVFNGKSAAEAGAEGGLYAGKKFLGGMVRTWLTSPMRFISTVQDSSISGRLSKLFMGGDVLKEGAAAIDRPFTPTPEEEESVGGAVRAIGSVNQVAGGLLSYTSALKALGPVAGNALMTAEAGNDTYLSLYDNAVSQGADPKRAHGFAMAGGAVAAIGTAAIGAMPLSRLVKLPAGVRLPQVSAGEASLGGYRDYIKKAMLGAFIRHAEQTGIAAGEMGVITGLETLGTELAAVGANGGDPMTVDAWWEATKKAGAEGGKNALVAAILGAMTLPEFKRNVRLAAEAEARNAGRTEEGRRMWAGAFPEGTSNVIRKRALRQDISRTDIEKAGYPEMSQAERNALGDALLQDYINFRKQQAKPAEVAGNAPEAGSTKPVIGKPTPPPKPEPESPKPLIAPTEKETPNATGNRADEAAAKPAEPAAKPEGPAEEPRPVEADAQGGEARGVVATYAPEKGRDDKKIQGTDYTVGQAKKLLSEDVAAKIADAADELGVDLNVVGIELHGSRVRGDAKEDSDLDLVVEYSGDAREDTLFEILNESPTDFHGIKVDINPINAEKTGSLSEYMARSAEYDTAKAAKTSAKSAGARPAVEAGKDAPAPAKPVEAPSRGAEVVVSKNETTTEVATGDVAKDFANTSDEDIDRLFNDALGERETGEVGATTAPAPASKPKTFNKGKKPSTSAPVAAQAPKVRGKVKESERAAKEQQAIAAQFGEGGGNADAVAALHNLFGASDSAKKAADSLGMAAPQGDTFDENVYNTAKPHFQTLLDSMQAGGKGVEDFIRAVATNFGPGARQYLKRFAQDLRQQQNGGSTNESAGTGGAGGGNGVGSGRNADDGRGDAASGEAVGGNAPGRPAEAAGGGGPERGVRTGAADGEGSGGRAGVRPDGQMAGREPAGDGGGASSGPVGNGLVPAHAGAGDNAGASSVVHAANGNIDTRKSAPVRLSKGDRIKINAQARELAERHVGSLTDAELEVLRQFTGAGGLGYRGKSDAEKRAALNQHFTDYSIVDAMWSALEKAKVPLNDVVEPSAGNGNFPGRRPEKNWTLVELDETTAKILRHLFPGAKVMQGTFEDVKLKDQDAFVSNVPFLEGRHHPDRPEITALHDYFFVHAIDQLKPNGVLAFITSKYTMDKLDPAVRKELMSKGDIIGAYRLPQGQFQKNAGTDVITDIIFIQRRPDGVAPRPENAAANALFESTVPYDEGLSINGWYAEHPENVLGDMSVGKNKMYGGKPEVVVTPSDATDLSLVSANYKPYPVAEAKPANKGKAAEASAESGPKYPRTVQELDAAGVKYVLNDAGGTYSQNIRMFDGVPHVVAEEFTLDGYQEGTHKAKVFEPVGGEIGKKIAVLQHVVDDAAAFQRGDLNAQKTGLEEIADYKRRFGTAPQKDRALKKFFKDHKEEHYFAELTSAFDENFEPADVWREQVRHEGSGEKQADENSSLLDQALASEDGKGVIEIGGERSKVSKADVPDLLESGYSIVGAGEGGPSLQNNVVFESGNIYEKIDAQKKLKKEHPEYAAVFDRQIARLESILPTPKVFDAINFVGVEDWKPATDTAPEQEGWIMPALRDAGFLISRSTNDRGMFEYSFYSDGLLTQAEERLVENRMAGRKLVSREDEESDASYMSRSREAEGMMADIYAKIRNKIAEDPERVHRIEEGYNRRYNSYVAPDYAKAQYLIKDTIDAFKKAGFELRANQIRWVTQALIEGVGINAHDVGGGKTMAALALAHALKQRGVAKKPMFVVPAKTINTSWLNSFNGAQVLFPNAKIVNLGNLPADKRTKMLFDLANSNADFVFISHEGFESIQLPPDVEAGALRDFTDSLIDATGDRQEAKKRDAMEAYIAQVMKEERDTRLTFDKLGIDCLIVDEAHNFKNVGVSSQMERQHLGKSFSAKIDKKTGRATVTSHRAHDFRFKADYIAERNNGRNVFLLTATPTPNKPIELYTMLRNLGPRVLGDYGITTDRDFAARFFETGLRFLNAASGGQKAAEILTNLVNVYDLKAIMSRYIDRIPMEDFAAKYNIKLPAEHVETMFVDMSSDMEMVQEEIKDRIVEASSRGFEAPKPGDDTIIGAFMNGRDAGVTPYVYGGPHARVHTEGRTHDPKTDKIELAVQLATHEVQQGIDEGKPRTVLIFTDVMGGDDRPFVPGDIKESLVARGFEPSEVAIVTGSLITNPDTGNEIQATGKRAQELKGEIQELFAPKGEHPDKPKVKVVIGSTSTIGEGLNLNTWTSLSINLDVPLTPGAMQQRRGRMVRFGNQHQDVRTINLMTRGSFDTLSFGIMANKVGWNSAIWKANVKERISVEEEMANGSGVDPRLIIIESLKDPVEKIRRTVEYDLEDRQRAVDQARDQLASFDARMATQRRNALDAQGRADSHETTIRKLRDEARTLRESAPKIQAEADAALADLRKYAAESGEAEKVDTLLARMEDRKATQAALKKAQEASLAASIKDSAEAARALDDAKKANGAAGTAVTEAINSFTDGNKPFARIYREKVEAAAKTLQEAKYRDESIPFHENIVKNAKRDIEAANARAKELESKRGEIEEAFQDAQEERNALGVEWYDDFGGQNQRFKIEKATAKADMDARNSAEDEWEDWMSERQTLTEAMPAPASTGAKPLNKGKLPNADAFRPTGTEKPDKPTTRAEIFAEAKRLFPELNFSNKGTHHKRGVLGWLEVENRMIRTVDPRAIGVLAHELGHAVSRLAANRIKMPRVAKSEFIALGVDLYGAKRPAGGYAEEGFAEFVRGFLCDYDLAKDFPNAHKWFFEDFGGANPDFVDRLFALKGKVLSFANMAPEHGIRAMWDHKLPSSPAEIPWYVRAWHYMARGDWKTDWVDSNYPIMRAMRTLGVDYNFHDPAKTPAEKRDLILNNPYMLATFFQGSALRFAEIDSMENTVDLYGDVTGDGLLKILSPIVSHGRETLKNFWDFAVAMRGADYVKRGMDFGATRAEIAAAISKYRSPEFRQALQEITDWNHRELRLLVDGGVIDEKQYQEICDANPVYVPMMRVFAENEINRARQRKGGKAIFKRKGGTQEIEHPLVAMIEQAARIRQAAQQGKIIRSLVDMYDRAKAAGNANLNKFMVEMPNPVKRTTLWAEKIKKQIASIAKARFGADEAAIKAAMQDTWTEELFSFSPTRYKGKGNIVTVNVSDPATGKMKLRTFEVVDPAIIDILTSYVSPEKVTATERVGQWLSNGIRMGATVLKGSFSLVANPIRDTVTAYHMQEYGTFIPGLSTVDGMVNSILNTDLAKTYFNLAGDMGRFYNGGKHAAAHEIAAQIETRNKLLRQLKKGLFNLIGQVFSIPEIGPRLVAFRNAKNYWQAQGVGDKAANFVGRLVGGDITIDFGRAGKTARKANRVFLFLNAAIRELDQLARASGIAPQLPWQNPGKLNANTFITDPERRLDNLDSQARMNHAGRFWRRGAALSALALLAYILLSSDEKKKRRWDELKPEYKWNNTIFDFGDDDGESASVRLPVPFLDGLFFQSLPVAVLESIRSGSAKPMNEVANQMALNLPFSPDFGGGTWYHHLRGFVPSAAVPVTDLLANENWQGQAIVPRRMERLDERDQVQANTTAFAKMMGEAFNMSPAKFEYLYDQYTGGLVSGLIRDFENSSSKAGALGVNGDFSKVPIVGRIFLAPYTSSRLPGDFYNEMDRLSALSASGRSTPEELGKYHVMQRVYEKTLSEYSKARRAVLDRDDLTAKEGKEIADSYSKATIDVIRNFNEYAKTADFREEGVRAAVAAISNPGSSDATIGAQRSILERGEVDLGSAQQALRRYAKAHGWSKETTNKRLRFLGKRW